MSDKFQGFSAQAMRFLRELKKNNDRTWFAEHKHVYTGDVLPSLQALAADITAAMRKAKIPIAADPTRQAFRIYRDVRFSHDKSPYKTNLGTYLPRDGNREAHGGLYLHVEPKASFVVAGFYRLDRPEVQRWREAMAKQPKAFETVLRALEREGLALHEPEDALKRMPRGFEAFGESPLAKYFRVASFIASEPLTDADVMDAALVARSVAFTKKAKPLLDYGWRVLS